jgi:hypothetical protein
MIVLRWKKTANGFLAYDYWTKTSYFIFIKPNEIVLDVHVAGCEDSLTKSFATVGAAKAWVTKNFA